MSEETNRTDSARQEVSTDTHWEGSPGSVGDTESNGPRAAITAAVTGLDVLAELPLREHVERFEAVHAELTAALSSIDKV